MPDFGPSDFDCTGTRTACTFNVPLPTPHFATVHCFTGTVIQGGDLLGTKRLCGSPSRCVAAFSVLHRNRIIGEPRNLRYRSMA
jgi:hypothetical protein